LYKPEAQASEFVQARSIAKNTDTFPAPGKKHTRWRSGASGLYIIGHVFCRMLKPCQITTSILANRSGTLLRGRLTVLGFLAMTAVGNENVKVIHKLRMRFFEKWPLRQ
jgi:hypothetical protein